MCEKCRLIELLDRELERWEVYHGSKALANALHLYAIERRDRVIAEAREKEDREMYEQPDPLAEWKALEPGRKVLNKFSKRVWSIVSFSEEGNCYQLVDENKEVGTSLGSSQEDFENNYQVLHEGPFDAGKLRPGDWFWISEPFKKWVRFNHSKPNGLISIIDGNIVYTCYPYKTSFYFSPPTPPSREDRIEKAAKKILGLRKDCLYCEDHGLCEAEISIVLTELMEGKP